MELDFKSENGVTVLTMSGRLDSATSGPAEQKISEELSRGGSWIVLMRCPSWMRIREIRCRSA